MHYLLTPDEFKRLRGFDKAREWETAVTKWFAGFSAHIHKSMRDGFYDGGFGGGHSFEDLRDQYTTSNPYPKLEDYLDLKSHEPGFNEDKAID